MTVTVLDVGADNVTVRVTVEEPLLPSVIDAVVWIDSDGTSLSTIVPLWLAGDPAV